MLVEERKKKNSLLLDANLTWGNILGSCCGLKRGQEKSGDMRGPGPGMTLASGQGGSQDGVVDEP